MTNWHSPVLEIAESLAVIKFLHLTAGVYFWEFVLNLDYEYSLIMGKRKFMWSVPLYLGCRWCTLVNLVMNLTNLNMSTVINCQAWETMLFVFAFIALQSGSFLIILRIYALWERKRIVIVVSAIVSLANTAAYVYNIAIARAHWNGYLCVVDRIVDTKTTSISSFINDLVLLSLMVVGVLRWKLDRLTGGGIWQVMFKQGMIYVLAATLANTPTATFLLLNLNEPMDTMFLTPSFVMMSICALRMHRGLIDSAAINEPLDGLCDATRPSAIRFERPNLHEENAQHTGGTVLSLCPTASHNGSA